MKIVIWTNQISQVVKEANTDERITHLKTMTEYADGRATWTNLTETEFVVLEDVAACLGLQYDGSQE